MNKKEFIEFLENLNIPKNKILDFIDKRNLYTINQNIFLSHEKFNKNQVYKKHLIFVKLKNLVPTKYLLNFISEELEFVLIKNSKQAINFTYSVNLKLESLKLNNKRLIDKNYYIVKYENQILGYGQFIQEKKIIKNMFNIGEYLKES